MNERPLPSCSIVVPTFNRPDTLATCLDALAAQDYPRGSWEVVVVDDGSQVALDQVIDEAASRMPVRLLRTENRGPASARNHGVSHADGALIAFTDDDCRPEPGWLRAFANVHLDRPDALLGGHTQNALPDNPYATASQLLIDYLYDYYNLDPGDGRFFTSNNMAVGRVSFLASGGFDSVFRQAAGEDRDLCARWRRRGGPLVHIPEARVAHAHTLSFGAFVRQHLGYGRGAYYFRMLEAGRSDSGVRMEPPRFYTHMMRVPFVRLGLLPGARVAALLVITQVANAGGYFWEKFVARERSLTRRLESKRPDDSTRIGGNGGASSGSMR